MLRVCVTAAVAAATITTGPGVWSDRCCWCGKRYMPVDQRLSGVRSPLPIPAPQHSLLLLQLLGDVNSSRPMAAAAAVKIVVRPARGFFLPSEVLPTAASTTTDACTMQLVEAMVIAPGGTTVVFLNEASAWRLEHRHPGKASILSKRLIAFSELQLTEGGQLQVTWHATSLLQYIYTCAFVMHTAPVRTIQWPACIHYLCS